MNKEKYIQFIAVFLIILVLNLTIYTPIVYATINSVSAKGNDGIEGYIKANDAITFIVNAIIEGVTIAKEQVKLGDIPFDKCVPAPNSGSECTLKYERADKIPFEGKIPFTVNVLDESYSNAIYVDNKAPQVRLSTFQIRFSSQSNIVVNYDVTDFACGSSDCDGKCAGIKSIDFYTLDNSFKKTEEITADGCQVQGSISIEPKTLKDGKNSIFAKATDKFSQASQEKSVTFTVDTVGPSILSNSFSIIRKGISLSTFSPISVPVDVVVNISADDLAMNSVTADFLSLNPSLKNVKATCESAGSNINVCRWNIELNPGAAGSKSIMISSLDSSGNYGNATVTKQLSLDDKGPVVQSLGILTAKGIQALARPTGNTITAVFDEATGLSANDIFLNIDGAATRAARCNKETSWTCVWENIDIRNGAKISLSSDSTDILGNAVGETKQVEVAVDSQPPILKNISMVAVAGTVQAFPGIFKVGDKIFALANLTDTNEISAAADFSKFISEARNVKGNCQKNGGEHVCVWQTDTINLAADDFVVFNFTDLAGNRLIERKQLKTLGLSNETTPDFWTNTVACSPPTIDRSIGQLINQRVYCNVKLTQKGTRPASTVFIGPATCTGGSSIIQSVDTFNKETGSTSPIIKITLKKSDFRINDANLSCSFDIFSKVDNKVTKAPEIENVRINLQFYNLPLGELGDAVQKKIDDAKKDAQGIWKIIGGLNKLVEVSKRICQFFGIIYNIVLIKTIITTKIKTAADVAAASVVGAPAAGTLHAAGTASCFGQQTSETGSDKAYVTGGKFCKFVNCQWAPGVLGKWQDYMTQQINKLPGAERLPGPGAEAQPGLGATYPIDGKRDGLAGYMDPNNNLVVAALFGCIPGVIAGLDKYSQIKCLYADCLQNAVGRDGLPITACENQKAYATCKYITGELFAVIPYTAVFDHFTGIIKNALSNPFSAVGVGLYALCMHTCPKPPPGSSAFYTTCQVFRITSKVGEILGNIQGLAREGFKIRQDYCSRLDFEEEKKEEPKKEETTKKK